MQTIAVTPINVNRTGELHAANERLLALRKLRQQARQASGAALRCDTQGRRRDAPATSASPAADEPSPPTAAAGFLLQQRRDQLAAERRLSPSARPPALQTFAALRQRLEQGGEGDPPQSTAIPHTASTIRVYPTLLTALLSRRFAAVGRVWLLARHLDTTGRGWLTLSKVRAALTGAQSPLRIGGRRRLRQLLAAGEQRLWQRDNRGRLWLYSPSHVAASLGVTRLQGKPVLLPLAQLLGSIGNVRAAFYACFHAGRTTAPISRAAIREATGVARRTQQQYDARAAIVAKFNLTISEHYSPARLRAFLYRFGRGGFIFIDHSGQVGRPGDRYLARRLPNSYTAPFEQTACGRQRKENRRIKAGSQRHAALVNKVAQGNGGRCEPICRERRYFAAARQPGPDLAADSYRQDPTRPYLWYHRPPDPSPSSR